MRNLKKNLEIKIMTDKEKAKAYDEALEKARKLQYDWKSTQNRAWREIETVFPELRESEDERIKNKSGYYKAGKFWKASTLWNAVRDKKSQRVPNRYILQECTWNIGTLQRFADEVKKVQEVELGYPIILDINGNILDGAHRVVKAYLEGKDIDIVYLGDDEWPEPDYDEEKAVKESEDERIRKEIIKYLLNELHNVKQLTPYTNEFEDWIAYLEKQKESDESADKDRDFIIYHPLKNGEGKYECIPYSFYGSLTSCSEDRDLIDFLRTCFYTEEECNEWIEQQKEQKPAEKPKWDDSDMREDENELQTRFAFYTYKDDSTVLYLSNVFVEEASRNHGFGTRILKAAEKVAETIGASSICLKVKQNTPANAWYRKRGYGYVAFEDGYDWLQKNLEYMKPAELSEGDKLCISVLESFVISFIDSIPNLEEPYRRNVKRGLQLIKSRSDLYGPVEWSEEDEEMFRIISNRLENFDEWATEQGYPIDDPTMKQSPISWLKSLIERLNLQPKTRVERGR